MMETRSRKRERMVSHLRVLLRIGRGAVMVEEGGGETSVWVVLELELELEPWYCFAFLCRDLKTRRLRVMTVLGIEVGDQETTSIEAK
jgi:hypothetical protein